jgi:hypothetical protein
LAFRQVEKGLQDYDSQGMLKSLRGRGSFYESSSRDGGASGGGKMISEIFPFF